MTPRFDAYTATGRGFRPEDVVGLLFRPGRTLRQGRGFHQFGERVAVADDCGEVGSVQWGGKHGDLVMVEVKGENTPEVVDALRELGDHRCTRVDSCADFEAPGAFEALLGPVLQVKHEHKLYGEARGDWKDFPEKGRTQYLGTKQSVSQARLYEKGKQPEYAHLRRFDWCRLEVQVRPDDREQGERYARLSPLEVWGAGRWTRKLAALVLEEKVAPQPAGTVYRLTNSDRALRWMCKQYGPHLVGLANDLGGWEVLGLQLRDLVREVRNEEG
jgi:hypothetical protein